MGNEQPIGKPLIFRTQPARQDKPPAALPHFGAPADLAAPTIRAKGPARRGMISRLAQVEPAKLALVAFVVSFLILAPLLQFGVAPPEPTLAKGFDMKEALGEGGQPFESGVLGMAAGGLPGQDTRVITPGDFHDPLSLIRTGEEKPEEPKAAPAAGPAVKKPAVDWKDVLSGAKKSSAEPKPRAERPSFSARVAGALKSMLSGLKGSGGGDRSGAALLVAKLEAPSSAGLTGSRAGAQSSLTRVESERDYRGLARAEGAGGAGTLAGQNAQNRAAFDGGRGGGGGGPGFLRDALTSSSGLSAASATGGGAFGGGGGGGDAEKGPGVTNMSGLYDRKFEDKETLGELAKKMNMQKSIDHKWKKREWNEIGKKQKQMEIKGQLANTALQGAFQLAGQALQALAGKGGGEGGGGGGGSGGGGGGGGGGMSEAMTNTQNAMRAATGSGDNANAVSNNATKTGNGATEQTGEKKGASDRSAMTGLQFRLQEQMQGQTPGTPNTSLGGI